MEACAATQTVPRAGRQRCNHGSARTDTHAPINPAGRTPCSPPKRAIKAGLIQGHVQLQLGFLSVNQLHRAVAMMDGEPKGVPLGRMQGHMRTSTRAAPAANGAGAESLARRAAQCRAAGACARPACPLTAARARAQASASSRPAARSCPMLAARLRTFCDCRGGQEAGAAVVCRAPAAAPSLHAAPSHAALCKTRARPGWRTTLLLAPRGQQLAVLLVKWLIGVLIDSLSDQPTWAMARRLNTDRPCTSQSRASPGCPAAAAAACT